MDSSDSAGDQSRSSFKLTEAESSMGEDDDDALKELGKGRSREINRSSESGLGPESKGESHP